MTSNHIVGTPTALADLMAILAAMQDQLDDLTATVEAQQKRLDELAASRTS
jgi:hypothetical protein